MKKIFILFVALILVFCAANQTYALTNPTGREAFIRAAEGETDPQDEDEDPDIGDPEVTINTEDPNKIFSDPEFKLDSVDPSVLEAWFTIQVNIPDQKLKVALIKEINPSLKELTIGDMINKLPKDLNLAGLGITDLTGMKYAVNVESLILSNNSITSLDPLQNLYKLESLDYSNNKVTMIPAWLFKMNSLTSLNGSHNASSSIGAASGKNNLENLYLEGNKLLSVSNLNTCPELKVLSLSNNAIKNLPDTVSSLTKLELLYVDGNQLTTLSDMSKLTKLANINASGNNLTEFPVNFAKNGELMQIDFSDNQIVRIPDSLFEIKSLEIIYLSFNYIELLPEGLKDMPNLIVIDIGMNKIDLTQNQQIISALEDKLEQFAYKIQVPNISLELFQDEETEKPKIVWHGADNLSIVNEGYINVSKIVIERKQEKLDENGDPVTQQPQDGVMPTLHIFEKIADLNTTALDYIDAAADAEKDYTYQVTIYFTGMYMENYPIDTSSTAKINTKDMQLYEKKLPTDAILIIAAVVVLAGALTAFIIIKNKKNPRNSPKKGPRRPSGAQTPRAKGSSRDERQMRSKTAFDDDKAIDDILSGENGGEEGEDDSDQYTKVYKK